MQTLVILHVFVTFVAADVSHLFNKPSRNLPTKRGPEASAPPALPPIQGPLGPLIQILKQSQDIREDGSYDWNYQTANGIAMQEQASIKNVGPEEASKSVQGSYQYIAPDGTSIDISYVADENGFHPQAEHLPTPPPIPAAILKALKWAEEHPSPDYQDISENKKDKSKVYG